MVGGFKLVKGVGHNDVTGPTKNPFYTTWVDMLKRCYDEVYLDRFPAYRGCAVCHEWLVFSSFKAWMEAQDWEGKELDKDLIGDGKLYSPDTCIFVSGLVNKFMTEREALRGNFPLGVSYHKASGKYQARCRNLGKGEKYLGLFNCPLSAHVAYATYKAELAVELANLQDNPRIAEAILKRYQEWRI